MDKGFIVSGLGMSGGWRISEEDFKVKHTHFKFKLDKEGRNYYLGYIDPRRFGRIFFFNESSFLEFKNKMAPDPTSEDFNEDYLKNLFKKYPERQLKVFLLDQKFFPGIGNYIACEICALSGIRPTRRVKKITLNEIARIIKATRDVIEGAVKTNGLSFSGGYFDATGEKGEGLKNLVVFHQKKCGMCNKTEVKKIVLGQRGTFYCPSCQK